MRCPSCQLLHLHILSHAVALDSRKHGHICTIMVSSISCRDSSKKAYRSRLTRTCIRLCTTTVPLPPRLPDTKVRASCETRHHPADGHDPASRGESCWVRPIRQTECLFYGAFQVDDTSLSPIYTARNLL